MRLTDYSSFENEKNSLVARLYCIECKQQQQQQHHKQITDWLNDVVGFVVIAVAIHCDIFVLFVFVCVRFCCLPPIVLSE